MLLQVTCIDWFFFLSCIRREAYWWAYKHHYNNNGRDHSHNTNDRCHWNPPAHTCKKQNKMSFEAITCCVCLLSFYLLSVCAVECACVYIGARVCITEPSVSLATSNRLFQFISFAYVPLNVSWICVCTRASLSVCAYEHTLWKNTNVCHWMCVCVRMQVWVCVQILVAAPFALHPFRCKTTESLVLSLCWSTTSNRLLQFISSAYVPLNVRVALSESNLPVRQLARDFISSSATPVLINKPTL